MKKYNTISYKWLLLAVLISVLVFYLSYSVVYAYFTATSSSNGSISTGVLLINVDDATTFEVSNTSISSTTIMPGDTINVSGSVGNAGDVSMYALLEVEVLVDNVSKGITYYQAHNTGNTAAEITLASGATHYTAASTLINSGVSSSFNFDYSFDGSSYGNEVIGKEIKINITAKAIQTVNLSDGWGSEAKVSATNIILGKVKG